MDVYFLLFVFVIVDCWMFGAEIGWFVVGGCGFTYGDIWICLIVVDLSWSFVDLVFSVYILHDYGYLLSVSPSARSSSVDLLSFGFNFLF